MATTTRIPVLDDACCSSIVAEPLDEAQAEVVAATFAALADPVRLRLYSMIASTDELCSCDVVGPLGKSQPTVSHHTKALADAGLIHGEKRGRWVYWRADRDRLDLLRGLLGTSAG